jgi:hypothetical protein
MEVSEGPGWRGHRDGHAGGAGRRGQGGGAVEHDPSTARPAGCGRDRDVDWASLGASDGPQRRGAPVAENCSFAAGEHSRHPPALSREAPVPDGINTAMNAVQPSGLSPAPDAAGGGTGAEQLRPRNHAVLVTSNLGNHGVKPASVAFLPHTGNKSTSALISPPSSPVFVPRRAGRTVTCRFPRRWRTNEP